MRRTNDNFTATLIRALTERIVEAQAFQFIAPKFKAHRPFTGWRIDVHDAAAITQFAWLFSGWGNAVANVNPMCEQSAWIVLFALAQSSQGKAHLGGRERWLQQGFDRSHHQQRLGRVRQCVQHIESLGNHTNIGRHMLVRQRIGGRKQHRSLAYPAAQIGVKPRRRIGSRGKEQRCAPVVENGCRQRPSCRIQHRRDVQSRSSTQSGDQFGDLWLVGEQRHKIGKQGLGQVGHDIFLRT